MNKLQHVLLTAASLVVACSGPTGEPSGTVDSGVLRDAAIRSDAGPMRGDSGPGPTPRTCDSPVAAPATFRTITGPRAVEDFVLDDDGRMVGHDGEGNLVRSTIEGRVTVFVPNASDHVSGIRRLSDGTIVYADSAEGSLYRVTENGSRALILSGLDYPNGMDIGRDGHLYVAEQSAGQVRRVHPQTGVFSIVASGIFEPNGVSFNKDYTTLYVGSFGAGRVYAIDISANGAPSDQRTFVTLPGAPEIDDDGVPIGLGEEPPDSTIPPDEGTGGLDGLAVDECGYVYVTEFVRGLVWRVSPTGQNPEILFDPDTEWVPNMQWGNGVGGWDRHTLYVIDAQPEITYAVPLGIGAKPAP